MPSLHSLIHPKVLHELCQIAEMAPPGPFVEVGVYKGGSAILLAAIAQAQGRPIYLYDTFTGMPEATAGVDYHPVGKFADTSAEAVQAAIPYATFCIGTFPETLGEEPARIAFAHVDCDQYATTKAVCALLSPRMVPGGCMVFDDYPCLDGARRAVDEAFGDRVTHTATGKAAVWF